MAAKKGKNKNKKKSKSKYRSRVDVISTQSSPALASRREELESRKKVLECKSNKQSSDDSDNDSERQTQEPYLEEVDILDNETKINEIFSALPDIFDAPNEWEMLNGIKISADNLVYLLQRPLTNSLSLLMGLKDIEWNAGQILSLHESWNNNFNNKSNENHNIEMENRNKNKNKNKNKKLKEIDSDSDGGSNLDTFSIEWDAEKPDYEQFLLLYTQSNKYTRIKLLGRVYWTKRYYIFIELIYLTLDTKKKIKEKSKKKIYAKDSFDKSGTTLWYRKLHWFMILFNLKNYKRLTSTEQKFKKATLMPALQQSLADIYSKYNHKKKKYKFSFENEFVQDCFLAIGNGWAFAKQITITVEDENDGAPKKKGRKRRQ